MDTQAVTQLSSNPKAPSDNVRKVAEEFESIFTAMMMKAMRKTVGENPLMPTSFGETVYTDMLDDEYSKLVAGGSSLGLAKMIVKQLEQQGLGTAEGLQELRASRWSSDPRFLGAASSSGSAMPSRSAAATNLDSLSRWQPLIRKASLLHGVEESLIAAVVMQESGGNPSAVSPKGAKGLMQLMDATAADLGVSTPMAPWANISGGTKYLRQLLDRFHGDERLALASYNAGMGTVLRYGGIPPYRETENYVESVLAIRQRLEQHNAAEEP